MSEQKVLRVYADGVFDSFHIGHANMFKQCRETFPNQKIWLIAGVCDQKDIEQHKEFLTKNNIDFVCHDDIPYVTAGVQDAYALCKKLGKFKATQRTKGVSTTDIVGKILKNKELYYVRNLNRGVPRQELGLSLFDFLRLKVELFFCPHRYDQLKTA